MPHTKKPGVIDFALTDHATERELSRQAMKNVFDDTSGMFEEFQGNPMGFFELHLRTHVVKGIETLMWALEHNKVVIAKSCNAFGKTFAAACYAVYFYKVYRESQVWTLAAPPESNLKNLLWGEIQDIVRRSPHLFQHDDVGYLSISRSPKEFIRGQPIPTTGSAAERKAKFSGKHSPNLLFIADEGDAIPDEIYEALYDCMTGGRTRLLIMFNPRHASGFVYRLESERKAKVITLSAFDHPNVVKGEDIVPGCVSRADTVLKLLDWTREFREGIDRYDQSCFEVPQFLEGLRGIREDGRQTEMIAPGLRVITTAAFAYSKLARYPARSENALISASWIEQAVEAYALFHEGRAEAQADEAVREAPVTAGLDVAEEGEDDNCLCFRQGPLVREFMFWKGLDVLETAERALSECETASASRLNIDRIGVGSGTWAQAKRIAPRPVTVRGIKTTRKATERCDFGKFDRFRDQIFWMLRQWLRPPERGEPQAMLPPDKMLREELLAIDWRVHPVRGVIQISKKVDLRKRLARSPDRADALALTFASTASAMPGKGEHLQVV